MSEQELETCLSATNDDDDNEDDDDGNDDYNDDHDDGNDGGDDDGEEFATGLSATNERDRSWYFMSCLQV